MWINEKSSCLSIVKKIILWYGFTFWAFTSSFSQIHDLRFQHLSTSEGLPHSIVGCIYQDQKGCIWFGTANGLVKYDGYKLTVYKSVLNNSNSLSNNQIHKIAGDKMGNLWLATSKGLNKFNPETGIFNQYLHDAKNPHSILNDEITFLSVDNLQRLWIYSKNNQLQLLDIKSNRFERITEQLRQELDLDHSTISMLSADQFGNIWFGCKRQLNKLFYARIFSYSVKNKTLTEYPNATKINTYGTSEPHSFTALVSDKTDPGVVWLANNQGLVKLAVNTAKATLFNFPAGYSDMLSTETVTAICFESADRIWLGTLNHGLFTFNPLTEKWGRQIKHNSSENNSLSNDNIQAIFADRNHNIWVPTLGGGVNKLCYEQKRFLTYNYKENNSTGINDKGIWSVYEDSQGNVWIGTTSKGIKVLNRKTGEIRHIKNTPGQNNSMGTGNVGSICEDETGTIWAITWNGSLNRINKKSGEIKKYKGGNNDLIGWGFRTLLCYKTNYLLIGSLDVGLELFDIAKQKSERVMDKNGLLNNNTIYSVHKDRTGKIWCGTSKGLVWINMETGESKLYAYNAADKNSIQCNTIMAIYEENDTSLWLGSEGCGLYQLNKKNNKLINYSVESGLPSNDIYAIYKDKRNNIWVSTGNGISTFDRVSGVFRNYDATDGIQGNEFYWGSHFQNAAGELFFGGSNGLTIFNPDSIMDNPYTPHTVLTEFRISNKIIKPGDTVNRHVILTKNIEYTNNIRLTYNESDIYFEFAGLHFTSPTKIQYAYIMEGYDKDWKYTNAAKRFAEYTNLDAGSYIFRVKSTNNDGVWCKTEDEVALSITITPPFWKTWWFRSLVTFLVIGALLGFYFFRIRQIRKRNKYLEITVKRRTLEIEKQKEKLQAQAENLAETNVLLEEKRQKLQQQKDEILSKNVVLERQKREIIEQRDKVYEMAAKVEAVNVMKMNFFSNISHEFRTPLTLIIDPLDKLFRDESVDIRKKEDIQTIKRGANRLIHLVEQITDVQKIETANMKLQASLNDIIPFINDIYLAFKPFAESHHIQFYFKPLISTAVIYYDADKIEKILYNLLSNAFKFTPENGTITLTVTDTFLSANQADYTASNKDTEANKYVQLVVEDTGTGIPKDKLPFIFDRFYHLDSPLEKVQKGTGIGLSLTKDLVELHKSTIYVSSKEGKNTSFTVLIPYGRNHLKIDEIVEHPTVLSANKFALLSSISIEQDHSQPVNEYPQDNSKRPCILLVEDDKDIMQYLRTNLEQLFNISEANNGSEGYLKAKELIPDLIISDVMMPEMDGFELCQEIKSNEKTYFIPFILLTAKNDEDSKLAGIEAGADDFITKPFSSKTLIARIKNLFENRKRLKNRFSQETTQLQMDDVCLQANEEFLKKAEAIVEQHLENPDFDAELFSLTIGMSYSTLYRKIKELTNLSINVYIRTIRLKKAATLLKHENKNVSEVAYAVGFKTPNYFTHIFKEQYGVSPSEYAAK